MAQKRTTCVVCPWRMCERVDGTEAHGMSGLSMENLLKISGQEENRIFMIKIELMYE